jgi:hypothetical protein
VLDLAGIISQPKQERNSTAKILSASSPEDAMCAVGTKNRSDPDSKGGLLVSTFERAKGKKAKGRNRSLRLSYSAEKIHVLID